MGDWIGRRLSESVLKMKTSFRLVILGDICYIGLYKAIWAYIRLYRTSLRVLHLGDRRVSDFFPLKPEPLNPKPSTPKP